MSGHKSRAPEQRIDSEQRIDEVRRAALIRMGRYAAYTAPAMTTLLLADRATAATSIRGCRGVGVGGNCSRSNPALDEHPVFGALRGRRGPK